jgi:hypothetical protein
MRAATLNVDHVMAGQSLAALERILREIRDA